MITLLSRFFIKDKDLISPSTRGAYGVLCGCLGVFLNILLFIAKLVSGIMGGSIAIIADAFNNLSDAGSSVITLTGFRLAMKKPDSDHPFGHGRMEYISALLVSVVIAVMGIELGRSSMEKILSGEGSEFSVVAVITLAGAILIKLYMFFYNRTIGKRIGSAALLAAAKDSLSDTIATGAVLGSVIVSRIFSVNLDGYVGVVVSLLIIYTGVMSVKDTIDPLLGTAPSEDFILQIKNIVNTYPNIVGIHDLAVHDYGPGRVMVSLHVEVPGNHDIFELHDEIDEIERDLKEQIGCAAVIHMDPVVTDDAAVTAAKERVKLAIIAFDESLSVHDFRMVSGPTHTNVIFDVVLPFGSVRTEDETACGVRKAVSMIDPTWHAVVTIDRG